MNELSRDNKTPAILVHGGAWATPEEEQKAHLEGVRQAAIIGFEVLQKNGSSEDAVQRAVEHMEADPTFNAGRGAVLNLNGHVELDAAIMSGRDLEVGAVASISGVLHAIALARHVKEASPHVMMVGKGAVSLALEAGVETCAPEALIEEREIERFKKAKTDMLGGDSSGVDTAPPDTVGAVACDVEGHVAAGTSTGGALLKLPGRVGDSPLVGSGLYADDRTGAASCTGWGEGIARVVLAHHAVESLASGIDATKVAQNAIRVLDSRTGGQGGIILVDRYGELGYAFNTKCMSHAYLRRGMTAPEVGI